MANDQNTKFRGGGVNINYSVANSGSFLFYEIYIKMILFSKYVKIQYQSWLTLVNKRSENTKFETLYRFNRVMGVKRSFLAPF